jgi:hypothetical protein
MHREIKFKLPSNTKRAYFNMHTIGNRFITKEMSQKGNFWVYTINNNENYIEYNIHYELESGKVHFYRNFSLFDNDELKLKETKDSFKVIHLSLNPYNLSKVNIKNSSYLVIKVFTILKSLDKIEFITQSNTSEAFFNNPNSGPFIIHFHQLTKEDKEIQIKLTNKSGKVFYFSESNVFCEDEEKISLNRIKAFSLNEKNDYRLGLIYNWYGRKRNFEFFDKIYFSSLFKSSSYEGYEWLSLTDYAFQDKKIKDLQKFLPLDKPCIIDLPLNHCSYKAKSYKKNKSWYAGTNYMANDELPELNLNSQSYRNYIQLAIKKLIKKHPKLSFRVDSAPKISNDFMLWLKLTFKEQDFYYESWGAPRYELEEQVYEQDNSFLEYIREYFLEQRKDINFGKLSNYMNKFFLYKTFVGNSKTLYSLSNQDFKAFSEQMSYKVNEFMHFFLPFMGGEIYSDVRDYDFLPDGIFKGMKEILLDFKNLNIFHFMPSFLGSEGELQISINTFDKKYIYVISPLESKSSGEIIVEGRFYKVSRTV